MSESSCEERGTITARIIWQRAEKFANESKVTLRFLTPLRLTYEGSLIREPQFHILIRNLLRRTSSFCYFYHDFTWEEDFVNIVRQAEEVELTKNKTFWFDWERYSSRQERGMKLGGLVGEATYKGPVGKFWGLLEFGSLIHIGKGSVFGLGKYELLPENPTPEQR